MADRKPLVRYGAIGARSLAACSALLHHPKGPNQLLDRDSSSPLLRGRLLGSNQSPKHASLNRRSITDAAGHSEVTIASQRSLLPIGPPTVYRAGKDLRSTRCSMHCSGNAQAEEDFRLRRSVPHVSNRTGISPGMVSTKLRLETIRRTPGCPWFLCGSS
jgi:hypothetical protein